MRLPPARRPGRYPVALVCLGNICRSPIAAVVLEDRLARAGLAAVVPVLSAGTGGWHVGQPMDPRAAATLRGAGLDPSRHRARQIDASWTDEVDLVLAMDAANLTDLADLAPAPTVATVAIPAAGAAAGPAAQPAPARLRLFREEDPLAPGADVPDPYYGGDDGFEEVLQMVIRTADALVADLLEQRPWQSPGAPTAAPEVAPGIVPGAAPQPPGGWTP